MEETELQSKVTVAVRVKPLDQDNRAGELCVYPSEQHPRNTIVVGNGTNASKTNIQFSFDFCHWSLGDHPVLLGMTHPPQEATQEMIYEDIGAPVVRNALLGFNCSIFAYGQTGSGKTFTMMGKEGGENPELRGLIPRISEALFEETKQAEGEAPMEATMSMSTNLEQASALLTGFSVSHYFMVSYIEIYMEKVRDLLKDEEMPQALRVRENPKTGPYVEGVTSVYVSSFKDIKELIDKGNSNRMVAATCMNSVSSRSHAVFTITYTKRKKDNETSTVMDMTSKLNLIDLAGSENSNSAGTTGERLKEGSYINKSLLTLGMVIKALAEKASRTDGRKQVVPYRDSVLTFLLRDSLGGNSRTTMVATVRPGMTFTEETLSTLRYADRAKSIVNYAVINEDPLAKKLRELQELIDSLSKDLALSHEREEEQARRLVEMSEQLSGALGRGRDSRLSDARSPSPDLTDLDPPPQRKVPPKHRRRDSSRANSRAASRANSPTFSVKSLDLVIDTHTPTPTTPLATPPRTPKPPTPTGRSSPLANFVSAVTRTLSRPGTPRAPSPRAEQDAPPASPPPAEQAATPEVAPEPPASPRGSPTVQTAATDPSPRPFVSSPSADLHHKRDKRAMSTDSIEKDFDYKAMEDPQMEGTADTVVSDYDQTQPLGEAATPHVHPTLQLPTSETVKDKSSQVAGRTMTKVVPMQGFLLKRGRLNPAYKRRYFVLRGSHLLWFVKYNVPESLRGGLLLPGALVTKGSGGVDVELDGFSFTVVEAYKKPARQRQWLLQASNEEERDRWVAAVRTASEQLKRSDSDFARTGEGFDGDTLTIPKQTCAVT